VFWCPHFKSNKYEAIHATSKAGMRMDITFYLRWFHSPGCSSPVSQFLDLIFTDFFLQATQLSILMLTKKSYQLLKLTDSSIQSFGCCKLNCVSPRPQERDTLTSSQYLKIWLYLEIGSLQR
jgi:hypothetical protein